MTLLYFVPPSNLTLTFKSVKIRYDEIINTIAASTFRVLLIHANSDIIRMWVLQYTFNNTDIYESGNVVIHAIVSVIVTYAVCTIIDICIIRLLEVLLMKKFK